MSKYNKTTQQEYYQKNKEKIIERVKKYRLDNIDKIKERKKEYYIKNKKSILSKIAKRYIENHDEIREKNNLFLRNYRKEKKEKNDLIQKKYRESHKLIINAREREKWKNNPQYRLSKLMSCRMRLSLKNGKKGIIWENLVDYSLDELESNLKHKIPKGFTWEDFLSGNLHIDHKVPVVVFNFQSPDDIDFKRCWSLSNLQLLPATVNIKKGAKLSQPFQPSLSGV